MTRRRWLLGVALGVLFAAPAVAGNYRWSSTGPVPGRLDQLLPHPTRAGELYAVTSNRGLYKSVDSGESWITMGQGNQDTGSWIALDPLDPDKFYVTSHQSILVTRDAGITFENKPYHSGDIPGRLFVSADGSILYSNGLPIRRSTDGGDTWTVSHPGGGAMATHPTLFNVAFLLTASGLRRTLDGGQSWEPYGTGLPGAFDGPQLAISGPNPQVLMAGSLFHGVYRSLDGGLTWAPMPSPPFLYVSGIDADPATSGRFLWRPPTFGLAVTDDDGETWSRIDPLSTENVVVSAFDPTTPGAVVAGLSHEHLAGQIFRTDDLGETWSRLPADGLSGGPVSSIVTHPTQTGIAYAASPVGVHRTDDGGASWTTLSAISGSVKLLIDRTNPRRLWSTTHQGARRSTDGGFTWETASSGLPSFEPPRDIEQAPSLPDTLYIAMQNAVYKSANAGVTWNPVGPFPFPLTLNAVAVDPIDPAILYAGGFGFPDPALYRSDDGGASWHPVAGAVAISDVLVDPTNPSIVYSRDFERLWKSTDRGMSFSPLPPWSPPGSSGLELLMDPTDSSVLYTPGFAGVFRSPDGGQNWHLLAIEFLATALEPTDLGLGADGGTLFLATRGGVFTFDRRWNDLADSDPYFPFTDIVALHDVTAGCGGGNFCPSDPVTRAQSSVFLLRSLEGSTYEPPPATGTLFADVPADAFAAAWIEEIADRDITAGCGGGFFCPDESLTRAQAAVLNLRTKNGDTYQPPPATGMMFADVPVSHFAAAWIEDFARRGYTAGCAPNLYCPEQAVSRGQMAVFLAGVFTLI
jgi:photosystem II stability/assembly factor-like uncharacterized protein